MPPVEEPYPSILDFLVKRFPRIDRETWEKRICTGKVLDEKNSPISFNTRYAPRKRLYYFREVEREERIPFEERIIYQNDHLLVADKPHFLPTTQGGRFIEESLIHRLRLRTGNDHIAPIHRIDRETAGLVMFSLNPEARAAYQLMFENREVKKVYHAISGVEPEEYKREWQVENRLVRGTPPFRIEESEGEANSKTRIKLVDARGGRAYFHLFPSTGKKHQLRHHMASLGMPIENDKYYPRLKDESPDDYGRPLQLLAKELRFIDPVSGEPKQFVSDRYLNWDERYSL